MPVQTKIQVRRDTAANWTSTNPTLAAGEIGFETDTGKFKIGTGTLAWNNASLKYSQDASLLAGAASITSLTTSGDVVVGGNLTVNGTTTSINSSTLQVDDKNLELGSVAAITGRTGNAVSANATITGSNTSGFIIGQSVTQTAGASLATTTIASIINATAFTVAIAPTTSGAITVNIGGPDDITADGAGITVLGTSNKTLQWSNAATAWTSNQDFNLFSTAQTYKINAISVLTDTQVLGRSINTASSANTIVARDASNNFAANTITANLTGTASLATNLVGGTANKGEIVYQSGVNTTAELTAPTTNNQVLAYNTSTNAPYWSAVTGSGNVVFATSPVLTTPNIGTPSFANLTSATALPISTGVAGLGTNVATFLATPSSANFQNTITGATGTGAVVFGTSPSLTTPALGVATGTSINVTGQLISTQTTGTAPLSVASTTRVTNLNAATAGVADSATIAGQANNVTATANNLIFVGTTANTLSTLAYSSSNNGQVLGIASGQPAFITPAATGVTNFTAGTGITTSGSTGAITVSVNASSALTFTTTQRVNVNTDVLTFGIRANTTQTANIFEARDGAANLMMSLSNVGTLFAVTIDGGTA